MEVWVAVATAAALAGWFAILAVLALATRPDLPDAAAPSMTLGRETPAVAGFLVDRWRVPRSAATATLLDLAARGHVAIDDLGDGTLMRLPPRAPDEQLRPYEEQILDLVRAKAAGGVVPAPALTPGDGASAKRWWRRFEKEVVADATAAGLAQPRWSPAQLTLLTVLAAVPAALAGALVYALESSGNGDRDGALPAAVAVWFALGALVRWMRSSRDTSAGRDAAAGWLGVRDYLADDESFPELPASSVTVWDRYLGYAASFGVARTALRTLPLGAESPYRAWSAYGGTWREVRIRYPRAFGWGRHPAAVALVGAALTVAGGFVARQVLPALADLPDAIRRDESLDAYSSSLVTAAVVAFAVLAAAAVVAVGVGLYLLCLALPDLAARREVVGVVLRRRIGDENNPTFVAVDDGKADRTRAWRIPPRISAPAAGQHVRAVVSPRLGRVFRLDLQPDPHQVQPEPSVAGVEDQVS